MAESGLKSKKLAAILLFVYLLIFPLGKLARMKLLINDISFSIDIADIIAFLSIPVFYLSRFKKPRVFKHITDFFVISVFSLAVSLSFLGIEYVLFGSLYLLRVVFYSYLFLIVWNLVKENIVKKRQLVNWLIVISFLIGVFGWMQYLWVPDLTYLKNYGWDDHLFRLAGTFLDPTFTSLFLVFGAVLTLNYYLEYKNIKILFLTAFFIISVVFTYTRASYLALLISFIATFFLVKQKKSVTVILIAILLFAASFSVLPRLASEGTLLERTQSIGARISNYSETLKIAGKYPLLGVGFNNMCIMRLQIFGGNPASHACSGSDSSILLVLATTGIVGLFVFLYMCLMLMRNTEKGYFSIIFLSASVALFVHSLFVQSAFYTFVMGYMGILYAAALKDQG